jgi:hypothetical protein
LRIGLGSDLSAQAERIEVRSVDGDGVDVDYVLPWELDSPSLATTGDALADESSPSSWVWMPIRIGRSNAPLTVRVVNQGEVIAAREIVVNEIATELPSSQPLVLSVGSAMGLESLIRTGSDGHSSTFSIAEMLAAHELPTSWRLYSACDVMVLSANDATFFSGIAEVQWKAIGDWIERGGGCLISLGENARQVSSLEGFAALLPGTVEGIGQISNPGVLESLVATDEPLRAFPSALFNLQRGEVELGLTDTLSRSVPWWVRYSHGLGTIQLVASDLGHQSFNEWKDRKLLWQRLIRTYLDLTVSDASTESYVGEASSYLGYSDLVGQLRATLDVFPAVRVITFGQIAAVLMGVLVLVGPIDYLVSVKWLKRPAFSWHFSGAMLLAICGGLTGVYHSLRPDETHINSAQIVDVDASSGLVVGRLWSHVYCGSARQLDVTVQATRGAASPFVDWQGLPGRGLGGLSTELNTDRGMPPYKITMDGNSGSQMEGVGVPSAGTKAVFASWQDSTQLVASSSLSEIPGVDQLQGQLVNPLDVDLWEPMLIYHNWYYGLISRIPAGGSIAISFDTIPKDLSRRLNGRTSVDGTESIKKWNPADRQSIDRLLELMMFHKASAGVTFSSLAHRFQPHVDYSNLLEIDRAILVGRVEQPWARVAVKAAGETSAESSLSVSADMDRVWCRIAIPVKQNIRK